MTDTMDSNHPEQQSDDSGEIRDLIRSAGHRQRPPEPLERRVHRALAADWRRYASRRRTLRQLRWLAAAAAVALLAFGSYRVWRGGSGAAGRQGEWVATVVSSFGEVRVLEGQRPAEPLPDSGELKGGASIVTETDAGVALRLPGAALLRIDATTQVRLDSAAALWLERGRLYVDSGASRDPISVRTRLGSSEDIGTQFEVSLHGPLLLVRVRDGQVRVRNDAGGVVIGRGEAARIDSTTAPVGYAVPPYGPAWSWLRGFAPAPSAERLSVRDLVEWYADEEGYRVSYASAAAASAAAAVAVHGDVAALPRDRLVELALASTSFWARREGDRIVIERRE